MAQTLQASSGGWTGEITVANNVEREDFIAAKLALDNERLALYVSRNTGEITHEECESKVDILAALYTQLYDEYGDALPTVGWTVE